jgi:outer membrane protein insertion porin family
MANSNLVMEIDIQGNKNIETPLIQSLLTFEVGSVIQPNDISKSMKNLYQLGVFDDVQVEAYELERGIGLRVTVSEYPIVESVSFKGNKRVTTDKIKELVNLKKGSYWAPFLKNELERTILDQYKEKGYHLAKVDFEVEELANNKVNVKVKIEEGDKVTIKSIKIHGNQQVPSKKILGEMKTKESSLFRSGKFEEEKFEEDMNRIVDYYNKKGFIDARIINREINIVKGRYVIDIYLYEGESYEFGEITVSGNERFTDEIIISQFKFKDDDVFDLEKFNEQLSGVASMYYEEGYIYSNFEHELEKDGNDINIHLKITENNRAKVHKIKIAGNKRTKEKVIRRNLVIVPGDYFRQSKVIRTQQNIYNMGFFEPDISLDYEPINKKGDIDLILGVTDKSAGTANGGIGINSQDGIVGQLSVSNNNLLGNAWKASLSWEFGNDSQNYQFEFTNPYLLDTDTMIGSNVYHTTKEWDTYDLRTSGGAIRLGRPLYFLNYTKIVASYSYYAKEYSILSSVNPDNVSSELRRLNDIGWQYTSSITTSISRDSRDNVFFPTSGSNIMLYSELAGGPLQGDFSYFKQIAQMSWYMQTFWKFVLRTKWRFGYVTGYNDSEVPPDERFYLGGTGADGLRGYADQSIGPIDGGSREIIFSTEYAWPITGDQIVGLLFLDAGDSFNKLENFNFWNMKKGGGIGLRVRSPFGLIGFDYAYNFDKDSWEPHFQFGTTF